MKAVLCRKASSHEDIAACKEVRRRVFIVEQRVPPEREVDGEDGNSEHFLLSLEGTPVGAARLRYADGKAKIERVAILAEYRGKRFGQTLMQNIIESIRQAGRAQVVVLGAQAYAIAFYARLGFEATGDEYMDAGLPHKDMILRI